MEFITVADSVEAVPFYGLSLLALTFPHAFTNRSALMSASQAHSMNEGHAKIQGENLLMHLHALPTIRLYKLWFYMS